MTANNQRKQLLKGAAAAFMLSLAVRLLLFNYYFVKNPDCFFDFWDAYLYTHDAKLLLSLGVFGDPPYPGIFRTPLYIVFVAAVFYVSDFSNAAVVLTQIIMSSLTGALVYLLSAKLVSRHIAMAVSVLFSIDLLSVTYANRIMSEIPFTFTVMLMVLLFSLFLEKGRKRYLALAGIAAGTAVLIRPILFYFPAVVPLIFVFCYFKGSIKLSDKLIIIKKVVLHSLIFTVCYLGIVGPWLIRNYSLGYQGIAAVQEFNIYMYKAGWIDEKLKGTALPAVIDFDERFARIDSEIAGRGMENTPYNRVRMYKELGMRTLERHPFLLAQYQAIYTARVFLKVGTSAIYEKIPERMRGDGIRFYGKLLSHGYTLLLALVYLTFLLGLFSRSTRNKTEIGPFIIILFIYMTILSGEMGGEARFRIPLMPLMLVVSASGVQLFQSFLSNKMQLIKSNKMMKKSFQ